MGAIQHRANYEYGIAGMKAASNRVGDADDVTRNPWVWGARPFRCAPTTDATLIMILGEGNDVRGVRFAIDVEQSPGYERNLQKSCK